MKVALIYDEPTPGGEGSWVEAEYESPQTIQALLAAIECHCHEAVGVPFDAELVDRLRAEDPDMALNIAEGREGPSRESIVPAVLELLDIPYTGSDGVALGVSLNKALTKRLAGDLGMRTPPFLLAHSPEQAERRAQDLPYPVLLKPNFGGSSVGIGPESIVHAPDALPRAVERALARYEQPCLVEAYVEGQDLTIGLLGNEELEVLPPGQVVTPGGIYGEMAKRLHEREVVCPCSVPPDAAECAAARAADIFRAIGARDFARADFLLDDEGRVWFLEINPLPGLSPFYGVLPVLAEAAGYAHEELIGRIMALALQRSESRERTTHGPLAERAAQQHPHR
jgi:D-alanine-D-alanine ligase